MAASFDGAGWLPLESYEAEVAATWKPVENALCENDNALCGQIIFQKDGFNMARRTPIADGLELQLELLQKYGYKVLTVSDLLKISPFSDLGPGDTHFAEAKYLLENGYCIAYRDNTVRSENIMTRGEFAMTVFGRESVPERVNRIKTSGKNYFDDVPAHHPYGGAIGAAAASGAMAAYEGSSFFPDKALSFDDLSKFCLNRFGHLPSFEYCPNMTRGEVFCVLADMQRRQSAVNGL